MYRNILGTYKKKFKNTNLVKLQMTDMSSYLPPLDPFKNKVMKLDDWQVKVFKMIEENKIITWNDVDFSSNDPTISYRRKMEKDFKKS